MKNKFSLRRIGLMLKADWIEYKKAFLLFVVLLLAANLFLFWNTREGFQAFLFVVGIFSTLTFFYTVVGWKIHRSKNRLLTLPASNLEKFVEILLVGFILFCVYFLIYAIILGISHLTVGLQIWFMSAQYPDIDQTAMGAGLLIFICTFLFMCSIAFRKYSLGIGTLFLILYSVVISGSIAFIAYKNADLFDYNFYGGLFHSNAFIETMGFLNSYNTPVMCIASAVLLYISYLKLKEKQIR